MKKVILKKKNKPKKTGFYLCLLRNYGHTRPIVVDVRLLNEGPEFQLVSTNSCFPLKVLDRKDVLWSEEIEFEIKD